MSKYFPALSFSNLLTTFYVLVTVHREHEVKGENQQDATNSMFVIKLLSQHVSGIIVPIIRRIRPCTTAYGVVHWLCWLWLAVVVWSCVVIRVHCVNSNFHTVHTAHHAAPQDHSQPQPTHPGRTTHAVGHGLILLMMGIMMSETS